MTSSKCEEATVFGSYPKLSAISKTRFFVSALMRGLSFNARDTVEAVVFSALAISCIVVFFDFN